MNVVNTRIQQRYDTLQNWQQRNPVLLDGELAVVATDNQTRFKIGDGEHAFNDLNFIDQLKLTTVSAYANVLSSNMAAIGFENIVGTHSLAAGTNTSAATQHAVALGYKAATSSNGAFVFNGDQNYIASPYYDHGVGTFNVNAPLSDIYVQQSAFSDILSDKADKTALDAKITIDDQISGICAQTDLSIVKLSANDYAYLVATSATLSNCLYIVEDDIINACGQQISNLAPGTGLSDAVNLEQLCDAVSSIQLPTDLSDFTNNSGFLTKTSADVDFQPVGNYLSSNALIGYETYNTTLSTLSSDGYVLSSQVSSKAETSALPYTLVNATLSSCTYNNTQCVSCQIEDRTITTISVDSNTPDVVVFLPQKQSATAARDFILRAEISATTVPGFTFVGAGNESVQYDSEDDEWYVLEPGLNLVSFTETK